MLVIVAVALWFGFGPGASLTFTAVVLVAWEVEESEGESEPCFPPVGGGRGRPLLLLFEGGGEEAREEFPLCERTRSSASLRRGSLSLRVSSVISSSSVVLLLLGECLGPPAEPRPIRASAWWCDEKTFLRRRVRRVIVKVATSAIRVAQISVQMFGSFSILRNLEEGAGVGSVRMDVLMSSFNES